MPEIIGTSPETISEVAQELQDLQEHYNGSELDFLISDELIAFVITRKQNRSSINIAVIHNNLLEEFNKLLVRNGDLANDVEMLKRDITEQELRLDNQRDKAEEMLHQKNMQITHLQNLTNYAVNLIAQI
jgi:hypothetical protein